MLIDRLIHYDAAGDRVANAIPGHSFLWILAEAASGRITTAQARVIAEELSGALLDAAEVADASSIFNWVNGPAGVANRMVRFIQIDSIIGLGQMRATGYNTPALVRAKLVAAGALAA